MAKKSQKPPTPAQLAAREKFAERARERAAKAKQQKPEETAPKTTISQSEYLNLIRQIQELKQLQQFQQPNQVGLQGGRLIGSLEKYSLAPTDYPDPRGRLLKESKLTRFALDVNYDLMWGVSTVEYTTIDNVRVKEPRFTLELGRKLFDEDTGEPVMDDKNNQKGYIISRLIMHEDPDAAISIARQEGLDVDETNEKQFLDEMRYLRMRDWLLECFFPTPIKRTEKKDMVIGGTVVETYAITSTQTEKIPFDEISGRMLKS